MENWFETWDRRFQRSLKRKNSTLRLGDVNPLVALRRDLAQISGTQLDGVFPEVRDEGRRDVPSFSQADRNFASAIGVKLVRERKRKNVSQVVFRLSGEVSEQVWESFAAVLRPRHWNKPRHNRESGLLNPSQPQFC